jgi:alanine racemase
MPPHDSPQRQPHLLWAEIDLAAIGHNVAELRRITRPSARLLVAVKANAYGHGAAPVARTALAHGATDLGVARIDEGIALRRAGIDAPILIFGHTPAIRAAQLLDHRLTASLFGLESARELSAAAQALGQTVPVHIKIDTGMGRLGLPCDDLRPPGNSGDMAEIVQIERLPGLRIEGLFTHFATADHADLAFARLQLDRFQRLSTQLLESGSLTGAVRHAANSAAIMRMPDSHLGMVRAGIAVYGLYPSADVDRASLALKPALSLKATIVHLKQVPAGTSISYGRTYTTPAPTTIATVPAGYADGYNRGLSNRGNMLAGGCRVPVVGRVCMDLTMIDVGRVPGVRVGDEVVLIGHQNGSEITADEVAATLGTINYEVVSALADRVPRIYGG